MRAVVQRVLRASVSARTLPSSSIDAGLLVLLGIAQGDSVEDAGYLVNKILNLRIFSDDRSDFQYSALDIQVGILIVSQFTLHANTRKGRRPDFTGAADTQEAKLLYEYTVDFFRESGLKVEIGVFGKHMQVHLVNDGPVTIILDSADRYRSRKS